MARLLNVDEIVAIINSSWDAVNKSVIGPIIRDADVKHIDDEPWKPAERMSIINMSAYETYRIVVESQLHRVTE